MKDTFGLIWVEIGVGLANAIWIRASHFKSLLFLLPIRQQDAAEFFAALFEFGKLTAGPGVLRGEDGEADRDDDDGRAGQNEQRNADPQYRESDD